MNKVIYEKINGIRSKKQKRANFRGHFYFDDRKRNKKNLLYILAGYKPNLWTNVFGRILREEIDDFDICILSSGLYSEKLSEFAENNNWSYLWSRENMISNIQNHCISLFPAADTIWKMDEDMFLCRDYFRIIRETRQKAYENLEYEIGFTGPLVPINAYGYIRFLKKIGKLEEYEQRFGIAKVGGGMETFSKNLWTFEANDYLWRETGNLDWRAEEFNTGTRIYSVCSGKYSIGAIMFERRIWENMGGFERDHFLCDGRDELSLLAYCSLKSKAIVVAEDALVGHYCFGGLYMGSSDDREWFMEYV